MCEEHAEHAAGQRKHDALGEQLTRQPPAPGAQRGRMEISRCRAVARASSRLATLAHAISSTHPTAPSSA